MPTALTETPLQKRKLYCLTICSYRKAGTTEEEYADYMSNHHSQPCKAFMAKYKVLRWHVAINTTATRTLMPIIYSDAFASTHTADYDGFSQAIFADVKDMVAMKEDAHYKEYIQADPGRFADTGRTRITIGWFEEYVVDGKPV